MTDQAERRIADQLSIREIVRSHAHQDDWPRLEAELVAWVRNHTDPLLARIEALEGDVEVALGAGAALVEWRDRARAAEAQVAALEARLAELELANVALVRRNFRLEGEHHATQAAEAERDRLREALERSLEGLLLAHADVEGLRWRNANTPLGNELEAICSRIGSYFGWEGDRLIALPPTPLRGGSLEDQKEGER